MRRTILAVAAAGALAAVGAPATLAATPVVVHLSAPASGALRYNQKVLHAHAGAIKIVFDNPSMMKHNVWVESGETELGHSKTVMHAKTSFVVTLKAGKYNYYCSVKGHEAAGMHGTLIVS